MDSVRTNKLLCTISNKNIYLKIYEIVFIQSCKKITIWFYLKNHTLESLYILKVILIQIIFNRSFGLKQYGVEHFCTKWPHSKKMILKSNGPIWKQIILTLANILHLLYICYTNILFCIVWKLFRFKKVIFKKFQKLSNAFFMYKSTLMVHFYEWYCPNCTPLCKLCTNIPNKKK